ncbi:MAG: hypothetical protein ACK5TK_10305 [Betaproteobacteria bacterium]
MKLWIGVLSLSTALLAGCATTPADNGMPKDYSGPKATLTDSVKAEDGSKAQVFAVTSIDGVRVYNTPGASRQASQGRGFALTTNTVSRPVAARPLKVGLIATHITAAPIHEIASRAAGTFFSVEGVVDFTPQADRSYVVRGELKAQGSLVWIEDSASGEVVTQKVGGK